MKRRGETFTEFLVATAVFGIMMGGLFEFMANQSETLSDIRNRDELMFYAQIAHDFNFKYDDDKNKPRNLLYNIDHNVSSDYPDSTWHYQDRNTSMFPRKINKDEKNSPVPILQHIISFDWTYNETAHIYTLTVKKEGISPLSLKIQPPYKKH